PHLKAIEDIIKSVPPEGVSQSDIDFYEEINSIREKMSGANSYSEESETQDAVTQAADSFNTETESEEFAVIHELNTDNTQENTMGTEENSESTEDA
ncbi:MAG: hypothetical protein JNK43_01880, partial [Ignavibacteria bacterium]|nr:hypothetical protein [Ignavibacteria bacterium]